MDVLAEPPVPQAAARPDPLRAGDAGTLKHTQAAPEHAFGPASPTAGRQPANGPPPPATPGSGPASKRGPPSTPAGMPTAPGTPAAPGTPSRGKPRILWKGLLALHDGTLLPGVTIVSHIHPWARADAGDPTPSTLEAEMELGLALEMVRHRPLRIVQVAQDDGVEEGAAAAPAAPEPRPRPRWSRTSSGRAPALETVPVWQASGAIYATIDVNEPFTLAYFERTLCSDAQLTSRGEPRTRAVVCLEYDASVAPGRAAEPGSSTRRSGGALQLALFGRPQEGNRLALLVARRELVRIRSDGARRHPRPDDPLPRTHSVPAAPRGWVSSDDEKPVDLRAPLDARVRRRGDVSLTPERKRLANTPGRRGEKRAKRAPGADRIAIKEERDPTPETRPRAAAPAWTPVAAVCPPPLAAAPAGAAAADQEAENRMMIKRLVRHQLVGRGIERDNSDHGACFQAAYAGTCLVYRRWLGEQALDRAQVANVVAAHLDMYVQPERLALCRPA